MAVSRDKLSTKPKENKESRSKWQDIVVTLTITLVVGVLLLTSRPFWWQWLVGSSKSNTSIVGFSGGCDPFQVYAQNRWLPYGTAIRDAPNPLSTQNGSFPPNMSISVNGWVYGRPAYPTNQPPFNSNVWYHLTDGAGWVSFGGVRATPVSQDPSGLGSGGPPVATAASCEGSIQ